MKSTFNLKVLISHISILLCICCSDNNSVEYPFDQWVYKGNFHIEVETVEYKDTISIDETLQIRITGKEIDGDRWDVAYATIVRDSFSIEMGLYAEIYDWPGPGTYPSGILTPWTAPYFPPPFYLGKTEIIIIQPDKKESHGFVTIIK